MSSLPSVQPNAASDERGYQRIRVRQDTADNWLKNDPVLASGEFGCVIGWSEPGQVLKIGDGTLRWSQLPWLAAKGNDGVPGPAGPPGPGPDVYEQETEPSGQFKDGDVWLQPFDFKTGNEPATIDDVRSQVSESLTQIINQFTQERGLNHEEVEEIVTGHLAKLPVSSQSFADGTGLTAEDVRNLIAQYLNSLPPDQKLVTAYALRQVEDYVHGNLAVFIAGFQKDIAYLKGDFLNDPSNPVATEFKQTIVDAVRMLSNGGTMPTADRPWTECPKVAGSGLVEARTVNGILQLRGRVEITTSSWTHLRNLPQYFPLPNADYATMTTGGELNVAERACQVKIGPGGAIHVNSFGQKITFVNMYPASCPV